MSQLYGPVKEGRSAWGFQWERIEQYKEAKMTEKESNAWETDDISKQLSKVSGTFSHSGNQNSAHKNRL